MGTNAFLQRRLTIYTYFYALAQTYTYWTTETIWPVMVHKALTPDSNEAKEWQHSIL